LLSAHRNWLATAATEDPEAEAPLSSYTSRFGEISLPTLSDQLLESELFGHKKGSFTGADREKEGLLAGDVSDILLDEIGDASPSLQAKLLGVIETRHFRKVGASLDSEEETNAR